MASIMLYGVIEGLLIALVALAFGMIYSGLQIFDISIGATYIFAAYSFLFLEKLLVGFGIIPQGLVVFLSIPAALILTVLLSIFLEKSVYRSFFKRNAGSVTNLIVSLAIFMILTNTISAIAGNEIKTSLIIYETSSIQFGDVFLTHIQLLQTITSLSLIIISLIILRKTTLGRNIIALSENPELFEALGLNIFRTRITIVSFATILIGSSAMLKTLETGIDPYYSGFDIVLTAAVAMIIGGIGSYKGIVIGGIILGIISQTTIWFFPGEWQSAITFILLIIVLLFRKEGLFAIQMRLEEMK